MSRCKGCNRKLFDTEIATLNEKSQSLEDLCNICKSASYSEFDYFNEHEYVHGSLKEGLTQVFNSKY